MKKFTKLFLALAVLFTATNLDYDYTIDGDKLTLYDVTYNRKR